MGELVSLRTGRPTVCADIGLAECEGYKEDCSDCPGNQGRTLTGEPVALWAEKHFARIGREVGELVQEKNAAYGDSFKRCGEFLSLLYPRGIQPAQYVDVLAQVRIFDKQMRIATRKHAFGESPYRDIAGYGILGAAKDEATKQ